MYEMDKTKDHAIFMKVAPMCPLVSQSLSLIAVV